MSKPFDATPKGLVEIRPTDWPAFLGSTASAVEVVDADVSTVTAGADKVLMGTDEPFVIAEQQPVKLIESCNFSPSDRQAILGGTAARLFRIS